MTTRLIVMTIRLITIIILIDFLYMNKISKQRMRDKYPHYTYPIGLHIADGLVILYLGWIILTV